jgi:3-hydroxyacyl-CoA dehydrogenase
MWQADHLGLAKVAERINAFHAQYGERWKIAPLIEKLAADGGSFAALDKKKR